MRVMEELGLDRPALFFVINLSYQPDEGARLEDMGNPYPTIFDANLGPASAARGAGLVDDVGGRWRLTPKGRELAANFRTEVGTYFATLEPIARTDLARLASLLGDALAAIERSDLPKDHLPRVARYRGDGKTAMGALDDAVFGLWQARDDCHMASWRAAGFTGPVFDVLTRVWRKEAANEAELATKLPSQRPADIASALDKLRRDGMVRKDALETTAQGSSVRQQIEDETDRRFFEPWPDRVGRESSWIRERLAAVNAALAPS
jgi:helix-turn-helix protein